jgi:predicted phage-related endonuclease
MEPPSDLQQKYAALLAERAALKRRVAELTAREAELEQRLAESSPEQAAEVALPKEQPDPGDGN